jgi:ABC-type dipeptide/oligopeptide/nickel transport system ATPase component/ABC-type dipeptide/oligopeptide/nickel transport system permease subunit
MTQQAVLPLEEANLAETAEQKAPGILRAIVSRPLAFSAAIVLVLIVLAVLLAPIIAPFGPDESIPKNALQGPQPGHWLGFDSAGRDVLSRLLYGGQNTLGGAVIALGVALVIGVPTGLLAGYYGRWFDSVSSWVTNFVMSLPAMIVLLASRSVLGPTVWALMIVLGLLVAPSFYRLVRGAVAAVRNELYVDAARVAGLADWRIISRHVLTVVRAPVIIQIALVAGLAIGMQAGLEFIGIGSGSIPTWGAMLNEAFMSFNRAPLLLLWPGLALGLTSAALVLLAAGIRDALDDRGGEVRGVSNKMRRAQVAERRSGRESIGEDGRGALLSIRGLKVAYRQPAGADVEVVHGIDLDVEPGQIVGLVGESGSGKSQTAFSTLGIIPDGGYIAAGSVLIKGAEVVDVDRTSAADRRRALGYVPQEPMSNLDPSFTIGAQLTEPLRLGRRMTKARAKARILELLADVEIADPARVFASYPHEVSGGMAQRVLIAGALSTGPELIIADEPTTALDVTVQAEVLGILRRLRDERGVGVLIVTHNLGVVADLCDRVAVMSDGRIVESGDVSQVLTAPVEEYTKRLVGSVPDETVVRGPWIRPADDKELS